MAEDKRILLVEDELLIAAVSQKVLGKYGFLVDTVPSGEEAIDWVNLNEVDLVLMDINLGSGIDGTQTALEILKHHSIPIIFLSSHTEREVVDRTEGISSYGYVVKNSNEAVLIASIRMAFKLFDARTLEKKKEAELRDNEAKIRAIFQTMSEGLALNECIYNDKGEMIDYRILEVNEAFYRTADFVESPVVGKTATTVYRMSEETIKEFWNYHKSITATQQVEFLSPISKRWFIISTSPIVGDRFVTSFFDITNQKQVETELKESLEKYAVLLKEVHHRIKNNIASIESFLLLQSTTLTSLEATSALQEAIHRLQSIKVLYESLLTSDDYREVSVREYFHRITNGLQTLYALDRSVKVDTEFYDGLLPAKLIVFIGIIYSEILTNSLKYAFSAQSSGSILAQVERTQDELIVTISDNGVGLDDPEQRPLQKGFGLTIVELLVKQIHARYVLEVDHGTHAKISIPLSGNL